MSLLTDLRSHLLARTELSLMLHGSRVYCGPREQGEAEPCITLSLISSDHGHHLRQGAGWSRARVQVDSWAANYPDAAALHEQVRLALQGLTATIGSTSTNVSGVTLENDLYLYQQPQHGDDVGVHHFLHEMQVLYAEPISSTMPTSISGLLGWWDARYGLWTDTSLTAEAGANQGVAGWSDRSGNGYHLTQSTAANRPTLKTGIFGSDAGVYFTTNDWMAADSIATSLDGDDTPFTIGFRLKQMVASGITQGFCSIGNSADANPYMTCRCTTDSKYSLVRRDATATGASAISTAVADTNDHTLIFRFSGTTGSIWHEGTKVLNAGTLNVGTLGTLDQFTIGALRRLVAENFIDAYIREIVLYDSSLSDANVARLHAHLLL